MSTAEGRELQQQADNFRMTSGERAEFQRQAVGFVETLLADDTVVDAAASTILKEAIIASEFDKHPERTSTFGIATVRHTAIVLLGAAMIAGPAAYVGGTAGSVISMGVWEAIKKSPIYAAATTALGQNFNEVLQAGGEKAKHAIATLSPFRQFVEKNEAPLRNIAKSSPQLFWMTGYIDFVVGVEKPK